MLLGCTEQVAVRNHCSSFKCNGHKQLAPRHPSHYQSATDEKCIVTFAVKFGIWNLKSLMGKIRWHFLGKDASTCQEQGTENQPNVYLSEVFCTPLGSCTSAHSGHGYPRPKNCFSKALRAVFGPGRPHEWPRDMRGISSPQPEIFLCCFRHRIWPAKVPPYNGSDPNVTPGSLKAPLNCFHT